MKTHRGTRRIAQRKSRDEVVESDAPWRRRNRKCDEAMRLRDDSGNRQSRLGSWQAASSGDDWLK